MFPIQLAIGDDFSLVFHNSNTESNNDPNGLTNYLLNIPEPTIIFN